MPRCVHCAFPVRLTARRGFLRPVNLSDPRSFVVPPHPPNCSGCFSCQHVAPVTLRLLPIHRWLALPASVADPGLVLRSSLPQSQSVTSSPSIAHRKSRLPLSLRPQADSPVPRAATSADIGASARAAVGERASVPVAVCPRTVVGGGGGEEREQQQGVWIGGVRSNRPVIMAGASETSEERGKQARAQAGEQAGEPASESAAAGGPERSEGSGSGSGSGEAEDPVVQHVVMRRDLLDEMKWPMGSVITQVKGRWG